MKDIQGFSTDGMFYKGNLYSHTTVSDGMLSPEEAVELFKSHGYHFLSLSEHDIYTDYRNVFDTEDFITIPSIECSAVLYEDKGSSNRLKIHHLHGILGTKGMQEKAEMPLFKHNEYVPPKKFFKEWTGAQAAQEMADMLKSHGMIVTYNHPIWSRVEEKEFIHTTGLSMLEIFNYNTVNESNTGYDVTYWDRMLRAGKKINGCAADDNHNEGMFDDACGGWICVKALKLTHEDIVSNIISGNYYASAGPEIYDFGVKNGEVWIECSPCNRIIFAAGNIINDGTTILGKKLENTLTGAKYKLKGHETYVRIECVDQYGHTAWTNPLWLEW